MKKPVLCMGAPNPLVELFRMMLKEVSLDLVVKLPGSYIKPGTYAFVIIDTRSAKNWQSALKALVEQKEKVVLIFTKTRPRTKVMDNALRQGAAAVIGAKYKKNEDPVALIRAVLQNAGLLPRKEHCPMIAKFSATVFGGTATVQLTARVISRAGQKHTVAEALTADAPVMVYLVVTGSVPLHPNTGAADLKGIDEASEWRPTDSSLLSWFTFIKIAAGSGPIDIGDARALFVSIAKTSILEAWGVVVTNFKFDVTDLWIHSGVGEQEN